MVGRQTQAASSYPTVQGDKSKIKTVKNGTCTKAKAIKRRILIVGLLGGRKAKIEAEKPSNNFNIQITGKHINGGVQRFSGLCTLLGLKVSHHSALITHRVWKNAIVRHVRSRSHFLHSIPSLHHKKWSLTAILIQDIALKHLISNMLI